MSRFDDSVGENEIQAKLLLQGIAFFRYVNFLCFEIITHVSRSLNSRFRDKVKAELLCFKHVRGLKLKSLRHEYDNLSLPSVSVPVLVIFLCISSFMFHKSCM